MRWDIYFLLQMVNSIGILQYGLAVYRTDFFDNECTCVYAEILSCETATLQIPEEQSAGHLLLTNNIHFNRHFYCQLTIQGPPSKRVQLVINELDIPDSEDCQDNVLRVFDGIPGVSAGWALGAQCGNRPTETVYRSTTNVMTLYYYQADDIVGRNKFFNLTYTFFHFVQPDDPETSCNSTQELLCQNRMCLSRDLACDQYDNCQDEAGSDESTNWDVCGRYAKTDPVVGLTVGGIVGGLGLLTLLAALICAIKRQKKQPLPTEDTTGTGRETTVNSEVQPNSTHTTNTQETHLPEAVLTHDGATRVEQTQDIEGALPPYSEVDNNPSVIRSDVRRSLPPSYSDLFPEAV